MSDPQSWTGPLWEGSCAFRLMPADDLADAPSAAALSHLGTEGLVLTYRWSHPTDGSQEGAVLVGPGEADGELEAAWADTWHQARGLMHLTGTRTGSRVLLVGRYAGDWGWEVELDEGAGRLAMTMRNVVPESAAGDPSPGGGRLDAGPYDVMRARWRSP